MVMVTLSSSDDGPPPATHTISRDATPLDLQRLLPSGCRAIFKFGGREMRGGETLGHQVRLASPAARERWEGCLEPIPITYTAASPPVSTTSSCAGPSSSAAPPQTGGGSVVVVVVRDVYAGGGEGTFVAEASETIGAVLERAGRRQGAVAGMVVARGEEVMTSEMVGAAWRRVGGKEEEAVVLHVMSPSHERVRLGV